MRNLSNLILQNISICIGHISYDQCLVVIGQQRSRVHISLILATGWEWLASLNIHFSLSGQRICLAHTESGVHISSNQPWPGRERSHPINMVVKEEGSSQRGG